MKDNYVLTEDDKIQRRVKRAQENVKAMNEALVTHGIITLTVEVKTIEEAEELWDWLYSKDQDVMKSNLTALTWKPPMSQNMVNAFDQLVAVILTEDDISEHSSNDGV